MYSKKTIVIKILIAVLLCTAVSSYFLLLTTAKYTTTSSVYDDLTLNSSNNPYFDKGFLASGFGSTRQVGNSVEVLTRATAFSVNINTTAPNNLDATSCLNVLTFISNSPNKNYETQISIEFPNTYPVSDITLNYNLAFKVVEIKNFKFDSSNGLTISGHQPSFDDSNSDIVLSSSLATYLSGKINENYSSGASFSISYYIYAFAQSKIDSINLINPQDKNNITTVLFDNKTITYNLAFVEKVAP